MSQNYETVIGLEVHAQLMTNTKIFCSCSTQFGAAPNSQTCPVCLGLPGVLPVTNKKVVEFAVRLGLALHCTIRDQSVFARKNYFYPDLPKGYQISQYEEPICERGYIDIDSEDGKPRRIRINRIHMEEDAGKSVHDESYVSDNGTLIDLNRCGTPLLEIVTEPDMRSPREVAAYLTKIRRLVRWLGVCDGNMEEGSLRCDANISLRPVGTGALGVKTELKNMNSIRNVERALEYEIRRQTDILQGGGAVVQETLLWSVNREVAEPMRGKEEAHDYRYFPDPDLVPVLVDRAWKEEIRDALPELPDARKQRWMTDLHLSDYDATVLTDDPQISDYFEALLTQVDDAKQAANWVQGEVMRRLNDDNIQISELNVKPEALAEICRLINTGTISHTAGKKVFDRVASSGDDPKTAVENLGLIQVSDSLELEGLVRQVLDANPDAVVKYNAGKTKLFGFLMGRVMQASQGKGNPKMIQDLLKKMLNER